MSLNNLWAEWYEHLQIFWYKHMKVLEFIVARVIRNVWESGVEIIDGPYLKNGASSRKSFDQSGAFVTYIFWVWSW